MVENSGAAGAYKGQLEYVFGDIKLSLKGNHGNMDKDNYKTIIDALQDKLHCNGIRVYIDHHITNPEKYPPLYKQVIEYARQKKLVIFANPIFASDVPEDAKHAAWIASYANYFKPEFISPFNESGKISGKIVPMIRKKLQYAAKFVGPEQQHVDTTLKNINNTHNYDIISSHNAAGDEEATSKAWSKLCKLADGKPVWATENPRSFSQRNSSGQEIGIKAVLDSPAKGLVIYLAYPGCVNENGELTEKGKAIAEGIGK